MTGIDFRLVALAADDVRRRRRCSRTDKNGKCPGMAEHELSYTVTRGRLVGDVVTPRVERHRRIYCASCARVASTKYSQGATP